jgi:hypothetical protein
VPGDGLNGTHRSGRSASSQIRPGEPRKTVAGRVQRARPRGASLAFGNRWVQIRPGPTL